MEKPSQSPTSNSKEVFKAFLKSLPLKIVILSFSGGAISVFPFFVLRMQQLGLTIHDIATIYLFVPIASLMGPIVSGLIADKLGKYNAVFICNMILGVLCYNCFLIIPAIQPHTISITCTESGLDVLFDNCTDCVVDPQTFTEEEFMLQGQNCKPCVREAEMEEERSDNVFSSQLCQIFNESYEIAFNFSEGSFSNCDANIPYYYTSLSDYNEIENANWSQTERECDVQCEVSSAFSDKICEVDSSGADTNFLLVGCSSFVSHFFLSSCFTMMDATLLQFVREHNGNLGKEKIMSIIGFGTAPVIAGLLVDLHSKKIGKESYFAAFMLSDALMAVACVTTCFIDIKADVNTSNIFKGFGRLIARLEVNLFLVVTLILGCNFGFIESYLFIYLRSLNASTLLLGLTMTVGCFSSIPMLFWADWVEEKIGRHLIFLICFTAYAIRMLGYSFIQNPWTCLVFELFEVITYQLMWVTCLRLCPILAPKGLLATMTGMAGAIHYSFGKGIGGFIGGKLIAAVGMRQAFRIFGGLALCGGIFYIIIHYSFLKRRIIERERLLKEEEKDEKTRENGLSMLNNDENRPSSGEQELHNSVVSVTGPRRMSLIEGIALIEGLNNDKDKPSNNLNPRLNETENEFPNCSLSHLYAEVSTNVVEKIYLKDLSSCENNLDRST